VSAEPRQVKPATTIREVALSAGVSTATVSRVLSGRRSIEDAMTARVRAAAAALDYRPNPAAQRLRTTISTVGVVVPDLANPYFAEVLKGISAAAEVLGQRTLVADSGENQDEEARLVRELARWATGLIVCSPRLPTRRLAEVSANVPALVSINRPIEDRAAVIVDFAAGIRDICEHLRGFGHSHVVYLQGPPLAWSDGVRRRALRAQVARGMRVDLVPCGAGITDGHAAADAAFATGATAVVAFSDYVALGVLLRAAEVGVRVPEDVSLTGFDDIPMSRISGPGLTTATVSKTDLGRRAHALLDSPDERRSQRLRPGLIVRGSTGPPRASAGHSRQSADSGRPSRPAE
jgi:LacI family transcriptional regulator, galactose operon repressor